jgi:hypothetical protein
LVKSGCDGFAVLFHQLLAGRALQTCDARRPGMGERDGQGWKKEVGRSNTQQP